MSSSTTHNEIEQMGNKVACFLYKLKEGEVISQFQERLFEKRINTAKVFCSQGDPNHCCQLFVTTVSGNAMELWCDQGDQMLMLKSRVGTSQNIFCCPEQWIKSLLFQF